MKTKILLTGASGFVGTQILRKLLEFECEISLVLRSKSTNPLFESDKITEVFYTDDLFTENENWFKYILKDIDVVIHAAWFAKPNEYLDSNLNLVCVDGSLKFASVAKDCKVKRFIGIGTCLEYDLSYERLSINTELKPISLYAHSKVKVYRGMIHCFTGSNTQFSWCRLFSLYGENENRDRLVPYVSQKLRNREKVHIFNGDFIRDYLDVEIAGSQIAEVAVSNFTGVVNICSGVPISIRQLTLNLGQKYGAPELLIFDDSLLESAGYPCIVGVPNWNIDEH